MPPKDSTWAANGGIAERDLTMAVASHSAEFRGVNWPKVKDIMDRLGYTFTKSAMEQRWTKKILKDWRA
ncbi:hypothetical protein HYQ45_015590 [Verticillium longisporum]|nr:hypothetical protein HYQ45_015590 [Verticillium longisporum]KAG7129179.1 hypothetical protein HYQ44_001666 [Verticillium longisporum]